MRIGYPRNQRGDTIVEVLISITVVSIVLVTAYVTSTRSINTMQDTQEHSEALQLAQTQLEYLHDTAMANRPVSGGCFDNTGAEANPGSRKCLVDASGSQTVAQPQFHIKLVSSSAPHGLTNYSAQVTWSSVSSGQANSIILYYQQS